MALSHLTLPCSGLTLVSREFQELMAFRCQWDPPAPLPMAWVLPSSCQGRAPAHTRFSWQQMKLWKGGEDRRGSWWDILPVPGRCIHQCLEALHWASWADAGGASACKFGVLHCLNTSHVVQEQEISDPSGHVNRIWQFASSETCPALRRSQAEAVTARTGAQSAWAWRGIYLKALSIRHGPQHGNHCSWWQELYSSVCQADRPQLLWRCFSWAHPSCGSCSHRVQVNQIPAYLHEAEDLPTDTANPALCHVIPWARGSVPNSVRSVSLMFPNLVKGNSPFLFRTGVV